MKINKHIHIITLILVCLCILQSCVKNETTDIIIKDPVPSTELQNVTAYGLITDTEQNPVSSATVTLINTTGTAESVTTDENGYYEFFDLLVKGESLVVSIDAADMFFEEFHLPVINNSVISGDLQLTKKVLLGTFNSTNKGILSNEDVELSFPENAIETFDGEPYSGEVNVYFGVSDPLNNYNSSINNGAAISLNANNELISKASYSNIHVELLTPEGKKLEVSDEHLVQTKVALQSNTSGNLSNKDLAVMYYDEDRHLWVEEAAGEIKDGYYIADLPHFSNWTWCEILSNPINMFGTVNLLENGIPINGVSFVKFDLGIVSFLVHPAANGDFKLAYAPSGIPFELTVLNECEETIYTESFPSSSLNLDLGTFDIETTVLNNHSLTVNVFNCDSTIVVNGISRLCIDELDYTNCQLVPIVNGNVQFSFLDCASDLTGQLFLLNEENLMTTQPISFNLNDQDIDLPYVTLCDTFRNNITLNVNGNLFYSSHRVSYAATSSPSNSFQSASDNMTGLSIRANDRIDGIGMYELGFTNIQNTDNSIYVFDWAPTGTINVLEFTPNIDNPEYGYPEHAMCTFSGTVEQTDYVTGSVIGTLEIDGTIYID